MGGACLQIEVTCRHGHVDEDTKAYADKKAQRLLKYYDKIQSIRVLLDVGAAVSGCEMIVSLEHMHDLIGRAEGPDLRAMIDETTDHMERQLTEHKDRTRHHKGRGPSPHQPTRS
jgi:putative sigma-54 modulation protein